MTKALEAFKKDPKAYLDVIDKGIANTRQMIVIMENASPEELYGMMPEAFEGAVVSTTTADGRLNPFSTPGKDPELDKEKMFFLRAEYIAQLSMMESQLVFQRTRMVLALSYGSPENAAISGTLHASSSVARKASGGILDAFFGVGELMNSVPSYDTSNSHMAPYMTPACGGGYCEMYYIGD